MAAVHYILFARVAGLQSFRSGAMSEERLPTLGAEGERCMRVDAPVSAKDFYISGAESEPYLVARLALNLPAHVALVADGSEAIGFDVPEGTQVFDGAAGLAGVADADGFTFKTKTPGEHRLTFRPPTVLHKEGEVTVEAKEPA